MARKNPTFAPRELALKRLSMSECSARELATYLKKREVPEEVIESTIAELVEQDLLNDQRVARAVTRSHALRDKGPGYIAQKLQQKGVQVEMSEARELFEEVSDRSELETARKLVARSYSKVLAAGDLSRRRNEAEQKEHRRAYAALIRRGFSHDVARAALNGAPDGADDMLDAE